MFLRLGGQALIASAVVGGLLVWNAHQGLTAHNAAQDRERIAAFAALAGEAAGAGRPLDRLVAELDQRDQRLGGRVALVTPAGARIAGPAQSSASTRAEAPVKVGNDTVAIARIMRDPAFNDEDRRYLGNQMIGIGVIVALLLMFLLVSAYAAASRWSAPQIALYRASREVANGEFDLEFEEAGPLETAATMRNLGRIARQFDRLETARRTWLVSIAEELRRPTRKMSQRLEALAQADPPIDDTLLTALEEDQTRLAQMAEDLHAVALADLGRLPVTFAQVDPRALIHNAIWASGKRAKAQGVSLETSSLPEYTILVKWDGARIEQLFAALIDNSLRYTPRGGRIVLGLQSQREAWRLIIDDSAPGVDVMLAQRLFEPFYRSSETPTESVTGSGLGLATARAIVEAHHGRIEATHSPIGGLRVTVILPANPPTA